MPRKLSNFLAGYTEYLEGKGAPSLFVKWSGIFAVAAALERKVWLDHERGRTYAGQYMLLTGPAGVGKGLCLNTVYDLLAELGKDGNQFHIAPSSVTKASLMDALAAAERSVVKPMATPSVVSFNSITAIPNEFGVFLPSWDGEFMNTLTDLWDHKRYTETRRTRQVSISIDNAQINLISGTTPAYLSNFLPEGAWEMGFMSRTLIIYSGEILHVDIFAKRPGKDDLWNKLVHDIRDIYKMFGAMTFTDAFADAVHAWGRGGRLPRPSHPKLHGYNTRREAILLKLCMTAAAANDSEMVLSVEHFTQALDWLVELEHFMPDVFKAIKSGGSAQNIEDTWYMAYEYWMKKNELVPETLLFNFIQQREPLHNIPRFIEAMCTMKLLEKKWMPDGRVGYEPKGKGG